MVKSRRKKSTSPKHQYAAIGAVLVVILALLATLSLVVIRQANTIGEYQLLEKIDNQACRYLDNQPAVNGGFDLNEEASAGHPKLTYLCLNGEVTKTHNIQGKPISAYAQGASVKYFSNNQEAEKYAEQKLNPLRYWGVAKPVNNIEQTSHFIFVVTDEEVPYFDAYTVKANAVLRVSLPCSDKDPGRCYEQAEAMLNRELKGINVL